MRQQQSKRIIHWQVGRISHPHLHPGLSTTLNPACTMVAATNKAATRGILKFMLKGSNVLFFKLKLSPGFNIRAFFKRQWSIPMATQFFRIRNSDELHCGSHVRLSSTYLDTLPSFTDLSSWKLELKVTVVSISSLRHNDLIECCPLPAEKSH
jgi:hypothetical protein